MLEDIDAGYDGDDETDEKENGWRAHADLRVPDYAEVIQTGVSGLNRMLV